MGQGFEIKRFLINAIAIVAMAFLLFPIEAAACSFAFPEPVLEVTPDFTLVVHYEGKPLMGVRVSIEPTGTQTQTLPQQFSGHTRIDGTIRIGKLSPGNYIATLAFAGINDYLVFKTGAPSDRQAVARLAFDWGKSPVTVRQVAGRLLDTRSRPGNSPLENQVNFLLVPLLNMPIELRHPIKGTFYTDRTDERGEFAIAGVPEGTFVLYVPGMGPNFLVRVWSGATRESLQLVNSNLCGGGLYLRD